MNLYYLWTTVDDELAIVDFKDSQSRLFDFFVKSEGDGVFLKHVTPVGIAQEGYNKHSLAETDYVHSSNNIPVFSARFVEKIGVLLQDDLEFHQCTILCEDESFLFFLGKTKKYIEMIDYDLSEYRLSTESSRSLSRITFKRNFDESFFIARDKEYNTYLSTTEDFKELTDNAGLNIYFTPRPQ